MRLLLSVLLVLVIGLHATLSASAAGLTDFTPLATPFPRGSDAAIVALNSTIWVVGSYTIMRTSGDAIANASYSNDLGLTWNTWRMFNQTFAPGQAASLALSPASFLPGAPGFTLTATYGRKTECTDQSQMVVFSPYAEGTGFNTLSTNVSRAGAMSTLWMPSYAGTGGVTLYMGGTLCSVNYYSNVFVQYNGVIQQVADAPWVKREGGGVATIQQGRIVVLAGGGNDYQLNDVWIGTEQPNSIAPRWTQMPNSPWTGRATLVATSNDYLFALKCGVSLPIVPLSNTVWMSVDGANSWTTVVESAAFPARVGASIVAVGRQIFVFGGRNDTATLNDAWTAWAI